MLRFVIPTGDNIVNAFPAAKKEPLTFAAEAWAFMVEN